MLIAMYGVRGGSSCLKTRRRVILDNGFDWNALMDANREEWSCLDVD